MEFDIVNDYKKISGKFLREQGLTVFFDTKFSDSVGWRPHIFAKNDQTLILDILMQNRVPELYIRKYIEARNALPTLRIYLGIVGELDYFFDVIAECSKYGLGIYKIDSTLKLLLEATEPTVEGISEIGQLVIASDRPYRNILSLKKCFRRCKSHLYWIERNLPKKALEVLFEAIDDRDIDGVETIKLLRTIDVELDDGYRDEFLKFRAELISKDISVELRVIKDFDVAKTIHGRYIYSIDSDNDELLFKLPPLNSLKANQWDLILTGVKEVPSFEELWDKGVDMKDSWGEIKQATKDYLKRKAEQLEKQAIDLRKRHTNLSD